MWKIKPNKEALEAFSCINRYKGKKIQKFAQEWEYEIKLDFTNFRDIKEVNTVVSTCLDGQDKYYVNHCSTESDYEVCYFERTDTSEEYSVFIYEGKPMLKCKKHSILYWRNIPIFKSTERFEYNYADIEEIILNSNAIFKGYMRKQRCKDFILDVDSGLIFSSAVTRCMAKGAEQYQYEIEYYGHFECEESITEELICNSLIHLAMIVSNINEGEFKVSKQTKLEFARNDDVSEMKNAAVEQMKELFGN